MIHFVKRPTRKTANGFTLIELLVVIAIIAILAAMLLPALARAKLKATQATCLSDQKQLALALVMFGSDNQDQVVSFGSMDGYIRPTAITWNAGTADVAERNWIQAVSDPLQNPLFTFAPNPKVIHCPGDVRYKNRPGSGWAMDSYSKTQNIGGESYSSYWGAGDTYTKLSSVKNASQTFAFVEDCDNRGNNVGSWVARWSAAPMYGHQNSFNWVDPVPMYHGNISTAAFVDGHAEHHKWTDARLIQYGVQVAKGTVTPAENAVPAGDYPDYHYVYMNYRAPGWKP